MTNVLSLAHQLSADDLGVMLYRPYCRLISPWTNIFFLASLTHLVNVENGINGRAPLEYICKYFISQILIPILIFAILLNGCVFGALVEIEKKSADLILTWH